MLVSLLITRQGGVAITTTDESRRDIFNTDLTVRLGLPFGIQWDFSVPYRYVKRSDLPISVSPANRIENKSDDYGLGDIRVGLAKTLLREDGWLPDLIGRVSWDTATGENDIGGLRNGFHEAIGSLTFLKRQDPLAFFGSAGYQRSFEKGNLKLGDQLNFSIGMALAASPETSLRFFLSQSFINEIEFNNRKVAGSSLSAGTVTIGASSIIGRGTFLNLSTGIGLTDDATDYSVGFSVAKRLNWLSWL